MSFFERLILLLVNAPLSFVKFERLWTLKVRSRMVISLFALRAVLGLTVWV